MSLNIKTPENWIKIEKSMYNEIGLINSDDMKCIDAYCVNDNGYISIVSFYDYSKYDVNFVYELNKQLKEIDEVNKIIDETNDDLGKEGVVSVRNIFHDFADTKIGKIYANINRVQNCKDIAYTFQVFAETRHGLMCAQCNCRNIDEGKALWSAMQIPFVEKLFDILFQLI